VEFYLESEKKLFCYRSSGLHSMSPCGSSRHLSSSPCASPRPSTGRLSAHQPRNLRIEALQPALNSPNLRREAAKSNLSIARDLRNEAAQNIGHFSNLRREAAPPRVSPFRDHRIEAARAAQPVSNLASSLRLNTSIVPRVKFAGRARAAERPNGGLVQSIQEVSSGSLEMRDFQGQKPFMI